MVSEADRPPRDLRDEFERFCGTGAVWLQRCGSYGGWLFPPEEVCPICFSTNLAWRRAAGRGRIWSWIRMHRAYANCPPTPYCVAYVELHEGPMMMAQLADAHREYLCGDPVEVNSLKGDDAATTMRFVVVA